MISIETPAGAEGLQPVIVPDFAMPAFSGPVRVDVADTFIRFSGVVGNRMAITSKLIDGTFPDYRRIIRPATATATVARKALAEAVGRCMPLCQGRSPPPVDLIHDIEGELVVRVLAADGAEIEDRIEHRGFAVRAVARRQPARRNAGQLRRRHDRDRPCRDRRQYSLQRARQGAPAGHRHADARHRHASDRPAGELPGRAGGMTKEEAKMERFIDTIEDFGCSSRVSGRSGLGTSVTGPSAHRTSNSRIGR